jgi:heparanase
MMRVFAGVAIVVAWIATFSVHSNAAEAPMKVVLPSKMVRLGTIDERYQSYNTEMLEVTGGMFWKPYGSASSGQTSGARDRSGVPAGMDANLYEYRPPVDLSNGQLRGLAAALGPAYVRVSGTWANTMYFADEDPAPSSPPSGFNGVLSRERWKGVVDFAAATDSRIVTSMATSPGVRDAAGVWMPGQAKAFLDYTRSVGGEQRSPKSGSRVPTRRSPSTATFVTGSSRESRCGSPRPRMPLAAEILGLPRSWILSAISTSWAAWPSRASKW